VSGSPMARAIKPRPAIAVAPVAISDLNCEAVGGLKPWKFRALLATHTDIPRSRDGHTLIVLVAHFYELLDRLRVDANAAEPVDVPDDDQPMSIDDVLARVGREVAR
jgi:hypothetical protein